MTVAWPNVTGLSHTKGLTLILLSALDYIPVPHARPTGIDAPHPHVCIANCRGVAQ